MKTSDILSDEKHCPKEMCQVIYNVNQNNDVVIKDNTNNIKCDFTKFIPPTPPTPGPGPTPGPIPIIPPINPLPLPNTTFLENKNVLITGIAVTGVAVLLFLLLMFKSKTT